MKIMLPLFAFGFTSFILFGDLLAVPSYILSSRSYFDEASWITAFFSGATSVSIIMAISRSSRSSGALATFALCSVPMIFATVGAGIVATAQRASKVEAFKPDEFAAESFFASMRNAPRDLQFFLHAVAMKNCVPYAWSYSEMEFYELPTNAAVNVVPQDWLNECRIGREVQ